MTDGEIPRAILLDALGTLVELKQPWPRLVALLAARHGVEVAPADARRAMGLEIEHYRRHCVRAADAASLRQLRLECAELLARELGPAAVAIGAGPLAQTLLAALRFEPFADARPALLRLRARGIALVVVSNWDISLHDVLADSGLRELLDGVVSSAEVGHSKPDPRPFRAALALAGCAAHEAWHVGDSLREDVAGARAAELTAVWLDRHGLGEAPEGIRVIDTLAAL
jgi:putative hydrolase of the HAD superfamily